MKKNINYFNELLRSYNKYRRKLANLRKANRNQRRQHILQNHIDKLFEKLTMLKLSIKMTTVAASMTIGTLAFAPQTASAQSFLPKEINPFNIVNANQGYQSSPTFADIDGDGDLDMLSGYYAYDYFYNDPYDYGYTYENSFKYYENIGGAANPDFAAPVTNPFGITGNTNYNERFSPTFVDIDGDGDMDLFYGNDYGDFYFMLNSGNSTAPSFDAPQQNPFSLVGIGYNYTGRTALTFTDLDNDGDFDLLSGGSNGSFYYFENTGTSIAPVFASVQENPFGLTIGYSYDFNFSSPSLIDIDNDGDFDLLSGQYDGNFSYFENTGSSTIPVFGSAQSNPFGLTQVGDSYYGGSRSKPTFADLDNDGDMDLMAGDSYGNFNFYKQCQPSTATISPTVACSYTSPSGQIHTTSGVFTDIIPNATGCDSIITINLTIESIADQTVSSSVPFVCNTGVTTIDLGSSQNGVNYYLRNNDNDTIVDGPIMGNGSSITFNTDTISSPTTFNVFGEGTAPSTGLEFDGNDDYIDAGTGINLANSSFSIEFWAKKSVLSSGSDDHIIGLGDNTTTNNALHIGFRGGNQFTFAFFGNDMDAPSNLADTDWHHWAVTFDAVTKGRMIYRDGVAVMGGVSSSNFLGTGNLKIGKAYTPSNPWDNNNFTGSLDEVRVWNSVRTQTEIMDNMNQCLTGTETNLLAYYQFEDGTGSTTLTDATVNANHGTLQNMDENTDWVAGSTVCSTCNIEMTQTITINVEQPTAETISPTACKTYDSPSGNYVWDATGVYIDTIPNLAGCDSVITVNLTVDSLDNTVSVAGNVLTANQSSASYRWLDCDNSYAVIPSETGQSFTAPNGNYAVEITNGTCVDTSACENVTGVGVNELTSQVVSIYPNPTNGVISVNLGINNQLVDYSVVAIDGRIVRQGRTSENKVMIDLSGESKGVYFLQLKDENSSQVYKVLKQ